MSDLPLPLPDRRTLGNSINQNFDPTNVNKFSKDSNKINDNQNNNKLSDSIEATSLSLVKLKQIEDMRQKILTYNLLTEKTIFFSSSPGSSKINRCNVILFGPSGSGKSSFIKSLYRALYNSPILPPDASNKLKIKSRYHNEGTLNFTRLHLVEETDNSSGIILCDTRGHFKMNENEKEQFKIILDGKVRDGMLIEQRENRDPFALWEFWKKSSELFPNEIINPEEPNMSSIPHAVVFIFDGSSDQIVQEEDEKFYKELIVLCKRKGYSSVHVILTRIDVFEKMIFNRNKNISEIERNTKLNKKKDEKIEEVIQTLGVNRSNIHFLENYHLEGQEKNSVEIDYHILKTMIDILNSAELFMMSYMTQKETCFCFGGGKFY
jgi:predicted AAA+ superfamily ATPase